MQRGYWGRVIRCKARNLCRGARARRRSLEWRVRCLFHLVGVGLQQDHAAEGVNHSSTRRGRVLVAGATCSAPHELRRRIGYAFQRVGLFPLSVAENVGITPLCSAGARAHRRVRARARRLQPGVFRAAPRLIGRAARGPRALAASPGSCCSTSLGALIRHARSPQQRSRGCAATRAHCAVREPRHGGSAAARGSHRGDGCGPYRALGTPQSCSPRPPTRAWRRCSRRPRAWTSCSEAARRSARRCRARDGAPPALLAGRLRARARCRSARAARRPRLGRRRSASRA